jgi:S1-C subfamily serine protease
MVRQGDILIAVGKLYGFAGSMGYGMATGVNNSINDTDSCYRLINTDITGTESSSGVLANINGKVVGIVTTSYNSGSTNLVTAYAVSDIIDLVERLCNGRTTGYFGIRGQEVTDEIKQSNGIPAGIYVSVVETNSPAYSVGIQTGDVICGINSKPVTTMKEFMDILGKYDAGDSLNVKIKRKGRDMYKEIEFNLMLGVE